MPEGREGVKALLTVIHAAFPDLEITVNRAVADGDLVVVHATNAATMTATSRGCRLRQARDLGSDSHRPDQ